MISVILAFFTAIPGIGSIITGWTTAMYNAKVQITTAKIGGDVAVARSIVDATTKQEHENTVRLGIYSSNKLLTILVVLFAIPLVAFEWKVILYDKVLALGVTDSLSGDVANWAQTIMYFLFGAPTAVAVGKMFFNRDKS